jgi:RNA polymerase sigma-70 factor (ECF subfamily)
MEVNPSSTSPSDLDLLRRAREGQWEAFEELVARFEPRVFRLTWRILQHREDAEDATQQTFISVMEGLDGFREEASVSTWVLRIATNEALAMLRKRRRRSAIPLERESSPSDNETPLPHPDFVAQWREDPAELAQRSEIRELVAQALEELDEKYRVVFVLRDIEQFSTKETAELLGISVPNVKVRLLRARLQLRERLTRALGDESTRLEPADHPEMGDPVT